MDPFFELLLAFDNQYPSYQKVVDAGTKAFGEASFRQIAPQKINTLEAKVQPRIRERWTAFEAYDKALSAWNLANNFIRFPDKFPLDAIESNMPVFEQFLPSFGDPGKKLLQTVKEQLDLMPKHSKKADIPPSSPNASNPSETPSSSAPKKPAPKKEEPSYLVDERTDWEFDHYLMLEKYYDDTLKRVSARCIQLGGLERTQYPFFDYVLDVLHELISQGRKISKDSKFDALIKQKYPGAEKSFQLHLTEYSEEFSMNAPEEMLNEKTSLSDMMKTIGRLDRGPTETDIGSAPDGFDPERDLPGAPPPPPVRKIKEMGGLKSSDGTGKIDDLKK